MKKTPTLLAIQLKRIGDLVLTTPALRTLREAHPDAHITLLLSASVRDLISVLDMVDEVRVFTPGKLNPGLWAGVTFKQFDLCLDFTGTDRSSALSALSRAHRRIGFSWSKKSGKRSLAYTELVDSSVRETHTVDHYLDLVSPCCDGHRNASLQLTVPEPAKQSARSLLEDAGVSGPYVILHPGSAREEKYWPPERWAAVADACKSRYGLRVVLTGSRDSLEQNHLAKLKEASRTSPVDLSGKSDLLTLMALIDGAEFLLGVDSASMHFAAAVDTPGIALFGPTNPYHWHPRKENTVILMAGEEQEGFTPRHRKAPMSDLSQERVLDAVDRLIKIA